jgi:hypothetical protein
MKKFGLLFLVILMFTSFLTLNAQSQSYSKKSKMVDLGTWSNKGIDNPVPDKISISSYVTKQEILTRANNDIVQKTVSDLPKYRYELMLVSKSIKNNVHVQTWIQGVKVFIDSIEVTRDQFPNGFPSLINIEPTLVYWYETSRDTINIKISWESSKYFENK